MLTEVAQFIANLLLPRAVSVQLDTVSIDEQTKSVTLKLTSTQVLPHCPLCQMPARLIHSTYVRTLADLPWAEVAVCLHLQVRKCYCENPTCVRKIFSERVVLLAAAWARRTA